MSRYVRHQSVVSRQADSGIDEDHWLKQFQKTLEKGAVQPRTDKSLFDQINSIMNGKSKYPSVEAAVEDMKERSGLTAYLNNINKSSNEESDSTTKVANLHRWYMEFGIEDGKEDLERNGFGSDILASVLAHKTIPVSYEAWIDYAQGYIQGSEMPEKNRIHEMNRLKSYLEDKIKKASDTNPAFDKKVDMTPIVVKKKPSIKTTIENYIRDTKGNLPVPAIIEKIRSIHQSDVSDAKDWDDDNLIRLVSKLNLEAKKNNPSSYHDDHNLGSRDTITDSEIDPSNTDAFFSLNPVKH